MRLPESPESSFGNPRWVPLLIIIGRQSAVTRHIRRTPLEIGTQIGVHRIDARLGEGGMGTVYRATDTKVNRPVAINPWVTLLHY